MVGMTALSSTDVCHLVSPQDAKHASRAAHMKAVSSAICISPAVVSMSMSTVDLLDVNPHCDSG